MNVADENSGKKRSSVITPEESEMPFISQRDFHPTPYQATVWEEVGERVKERDFVALEVSILPGENSAPDPMFDIFDAGLAGTHDSFIVGVGGKRVDGAAEGEKAELNQAQLDQIEAVWLERVQQAREEGIQEGIRATEGGVLERYEELSQKLKAVTDAIYRQWSGLAIQLEKRSVELALQISRKILTTTAEIKPDYIVDVIREALQAMGAAKPVRIRVSHDDFEFLNVIGLPVDISEQELGVTYLADDSIKSGCVVETDYGEVDLVLEKMWEQVRQNLAGAFK